MKDALRRAGRTFGQAFVGVLAVIAIPQLTSIIATVTKGGDIEFDLKVWQNILVAAIVAGIVALISWAQNALEEKGVVPAVLKPDVVPTAEAKQAVEKAYTAQPGVDPIPTVKS